MINYRKITIILPLLLLLTGLLGPFASDIVAGEPASCHGKTNDKCSFEVENFRGNQLKDDYGRGDSITFFCDVDGRKDITVRGVVEGDNRGYTQGKRIDASEVEKDLWRFEWQVPYDWQAETATVYCSGSFQEVNDRSQPLTIKIGPPKELKIRAQVEDARGRNAGSLSLRKSRGEGKKSKEAPKEEGEVQTASQANSIQVAGKTSQVKDQATQEKSVQSAVTLTPGIYQAQIKAEKGTASIR